MVERLAGVDGRHAGGHHHERPEAVLSDLPLGRGEAAGLDEVLFQDERAREDLEGVLCRTTEGGDDDVMVCGPECCRASRVSTIREPVRLY